MFKNLIIYLLLFFSHPVVAEIAFAVGINVTYELDAGLTIKAVSNDKIDEYVVAVGTSYYPFSKDKPGLDLGLGRTTGFNMIFLYGIDIYKDDSYMSFGFMNTSSP